MNKFEAKATIIADSIDEAGVRITTFELEYWRAIHAEFMTHRLFSRNAASSRAIPTKNILEMIRSAPAGPVHWGKNQPGMKARAEHDLPISKEDGQHVYTREEAWLAAARDAAGWAEAFSDAEYHKQLVNRILEPFSPIKVVCTSTEWDNFFWLRDHEDAQPEIQDLARKMKAAYDASTPTELSEGEWHVPYVERYRDESGILHYYTLMNESEGVELSVEDALKISSSCCAQVSYRKNDTSIEKAKKIYDALVESEPPHFSPFEHQAMVAVWDDFEVPMDGKTPMLMNIPRGLTHMDRRGFCWSGNFRNWIQHRQLLMHDMGLEPMTSSKKKPKQ